MSDLSAAAQELNEDLRLLMHDTVDAPNTVKERVWGSAAGVPRKVEESRALYRVPIVEAFAVSGAATLAEFPERVRDLLERAALRADLRNENARLRHERDRYKALAEQQSATVAEGAKAVAALGSGSLAELKASRDSLSGRVSDLTAENDGLRRSVRRLCRILGKAMAGDL